MKYECDNNGRTVYQGRSIHYKKGEGDYIPHSLDHVGACRMIEGSYKAVVTESEKRETIIPKPLKGTIPEIKEWLDNHDVEYSSTARKPELLEILENA